MMFTCVAALAPAPVPVATELAVGLLDVPAVEDAAGVNCTPFMDASVTMASPILIQSSYQQSAFLVRILEKV